tara:strand:+ start:619 stop:804 length:186 start_codon:yes stop_codon:yes gene_type:complete
VYGSKADMKLAYEECWRQKEDLEGELKKDKELKQFIQNLISIGCLNDFYHKKAKELMEEQC